MTAKEKLNNINYDQVVYDYRKNTTGTGTTQQLLRHFLIKEILPVIELACKETARNVIHKMCNKLYEYDRPTEYGDLEDQIRKDIMNIQFDKINPLRNDS